MKRLMIYGLVCLGLLLILPTLFAQQSFNVTAEAINQANLRETTNVESVLLGQIVTGTRYPVIGRSEYFPWVLLGDPTTQQPLGWVFIDLVTIQGDISQVPFTRMTVNLNALPTATRQANALQGVTVTGEPALLSTATQTPSFQVAGIAKGEINIRYGPGIDYPRVGVAKAGDRFEIVRWHTQFPWVQVRYEHAPNGLAWIANDLLDIQGDVFRLPSLSQTVFDLPTLTPTPAVVQSSALLGTTRVPLGADFQALGNQIWNIVLSAGFDPQTSRTGALFLLDLQTGEAITLGSDLAFSGTSINKIAILAALYGVLDFPPTTAEAVDIANTMICSENAATNRLLSIIGEGDEYLGADRVTEFLWALGLNKTFITAPYVLDPSKIPTPPRPIQYPRTAADQTRANPDPSNQLTVEEMGWLLGSIYQCAYNDSGPLMTAFPGAYTSRECKQMLHVMSNNTVDALLKAGVPADTRVAHKHGWIADTHGNAALLFTPNGDYVIVMMLFQPTWLDYSQSLPVIAEVSRVVYNYYNPAAPQSTIRDGFIPETVTCNFAGTPLISDLTSAFFSD